MTVINKIRHTTIAEKTVVPKSLLDQSLGLLKYKTPTAMLLKTHFGIHTFGMKYPIDVLILDKQNRVTSMKENMKPNSIFVWNIKHNTVLELPPGTLKKTNTKRSDQLKIYS